MRQLQKFKKLFKISFLSLILIVFFYLTFNVKYDDRPRILKLNLNQQKLQPRSKIILESGIVLNDGLTEQAHRFIKELNLTNPGLDGKPVLIKNNLITEEHRTFIRAGFKEFGSNVFVSNLISLNRQISDNRSEYCKNKVYSKDLPKVSVVIAFYNEPWSVLMRLVHSVLINTPEHLLEEIVLSDDYSDKDHLKEPLEEYLKTLKKVKLVRSHTRLGVVGARVLGFRNAKGPVMVSLDSHMEVAVGWLIPMLDRLKDNKTLLTYTSSANIHKKTYKIMYKDSNGWLGGVNFGLVFTIKTETFY